MLTLTVAKPGTALAFDERQGNCWGCCTLGSVLLDDAALMAASLHATHGPHGLLQKGLLSKADLRSCMQETAAQGVSICTRKPSLWLFLVCCMRTSSKLACPIEDYLLR